MHTYRQKFELFPSLSLLFGTFIFFAFLQSCGDPAPEPEVIEVDDQQALEQAGQIRSEVSVDLAEGLELSLWASEEMVKDPVALHMADDGRAWVTMTNRSNSSEFDIRRWPQWRTESLSFRTVEDRREFLQEYFAPQHSEQNSDVIPDRNGDGSHDWRDLTVEKEEVHVIEDATGSGVANRSQLFIRDFHQEVTDVAASVLYHQGEVFVGVAPDMWRLRDTSGDGMADVKESISQGYGVHISIWGHGMSGLTMGPDGRIYWAIGDPGFNVTDQEGTHWDYPHQGAIFRSEPDGSNFEVYARGLRNTHEFAFDKYGNLITVDNDGDFPGEFERLLYVVNGADGGWRTHWQFGKYGDPKNNDYNVWSQERFYYPPFDGQAAHVLPSLGEFHNGPAGMTYNPGTGLNERWKDHFFVVSFVGSPVRSAVHAIRLEPDGAAYRLANDEPFLTGIAGSGLDFGPDGALYLADWIEGWSQNQEGRIWKIDTEQTDFEARSETRELLGASFADYEGGQLVELMGHGDMRVRQKAQFELAGRGEAELLARAIGDEDQLRRIHAVWGIGQLGRQDQAHMQVLLDWLDDSDPEIRAQTARMLGDVRWEPAADQLIGRLDDEHPRVRFFAAEALGRIAYEPAFDPIVEMLEANDDEDLFLRQAGAIALERIGNVDGLVRLSEHSSRAVRIAAVVALRGLGDSGVARFLDDEDEFIVTNAARAINDDGHIEQALPALSRILEQERFTNEALLRRAINAALYHGTATDATRLAGLALRGDVDSELRSEALAALSVWTESSPLDRVSGRYRGPVEHEPELAWQALEPVLERLLFETPEEVRLAGVEAVRGLDYRPGLQYLAELLEADPAGQVRQAALGALQALGYEAMEEAFALASEDSDPDVRGRALELLADSNIDRQTLITLLAPILEDGPAGERQQALTVLGQIDHPAAYELLGDYMDRLETGTLAPELELELTEAVGRTGHEPLSNRLEAYHAGKPGDEPVAQYREALYGGDAERGRTIFYEHAAGQCMRCHVVDGEGSDVGPDLTGVGNRLSRELLLQSLVAPAERIAPGYGSVTVRLEDGRTLQGLVEAKTGTTITIRSDGESHQVDRTDIAERVSATSGMPPMGELLTRQELRDLVEYMTSMQ